MYLLTISLSLDLSTTQAGPSGKRCSKQVLLILAHVVYKGEAVSCVPSHRAGRGADTLQFYLGTHRKWLPRMSPL